MQDGVDCRIKYCKDRLDCHNFFLRYYNILKFELYILVRTINKKYLTLNLKLKKEYNNVKFIEIDERCFL